MKNDNRKLNAVIFEYTLRSDNKYLGTGTGGNLDHYLFIADKNLIPSSDIQSFEIKGNDVLFNPEYIEKTASNKIRADLDVVIAKAIADTNFVAPFTYTDGIIRYDESLVAKSPTAQKAADALKMCAGFAIDLDAGKLTDQNITNLVDYLKSVDIGIATLAIRTQIGIERIVSNNLDENEKFSPLFQEINAAFK